MANTGAARFYKRLVGIKCGRWKPPDSTEFEYVERLSKWKLSADEWNMALDLIEKDRDLPEGMPQLSPTIYDYLKVAINAGKKPSGSVRHWITFDCEQKPFGVLRFAAICHDPMNPPLPPDRATGLSLHPDPSTITLRDYQPCTRTEAQEAFRRGWLESGAAFDKCPRIDRLETILPDLEEVEA